MAKNQKESNKKSKNVSKILGKVMAGFLAVLMVLGVGATLIYCLIGM